MAQSRESIDVSLRELLASLSSAETAHGAVSAAAVAGGLATSLLLMVAAVPKTRSDSARDRTLRAAFSGAQSNLEARLSSLTDVLYTTAIIDEIARLSEEAASAATAAAVAVQVPPA